MFSSFHIIIIICLLHSTHSAHFKRFSNAFQPGDLVLDWGSGCGHELALLRSLFGISGFGIDMVTDAVSFAKRKQLIEIPVKYLSCSA